MSMNYEVTSTIETIAKMVNLGMMPESEALAMAAQMGAALLRYEIAKRPDEQVVLLPKLEELTHGN